MTLPESKPPSAPQPGEPSVLDLFKSVTRDWHSFLNFIGSLASV